jgi:hypothetical protein
VTATIIIYRTLPSPAKRAEPGPQMPCHIPLPFSLHVQDHASPYLQSTEDYTDKKSNQIFLKEIQSGAVAKSYMTNGLLSEILGNICAFPHKLGNPSSYMTLQLLQSEFPCI